ncbi:hypothetical protein GGX14DRAFT_555307 [Mycena pura]|uniref:Uncharacterized protein n=1 Tax=Mycena pura TaxID=153505 RepID=A0AAD6YQT1_9AGAR|nr:hypothetical protein GGX14DRAFT_555307 [Mycena pura]
MRLPVIVPLVVPVPCVPTARARTAAARVPRPPCARTPRSTYGYSSRTHRPARTHPLPFLYPCPYSRTLGPSESYIKRVFTHNRVPIAQHLLVPPRAHAICLTRRAYPVLVPVPSHSPRELPPFTRIPHAGRRSYLPLPINILPLVAVPVPVLLAPVPVPIVPVLLVPLLVPVPVPIVSVPLVLLPVGQFILNQFHTAAAIT